MQIRVFLWFQQLSREGRSKRLSLTDSVWCEIGCERLGTFFQMLEELFTGTARFFSASVNRPL